MRSHHLIQRSLPAAAMLLSLLVILSGVLAWSPAATYALTALMFAAIFAARSVGVHHRRR
jgi:hypothetical protein